VWLTRRGPFPGESHPHFGPLALVAPKLRPIGQRGDQPDAQTERVVRCLHPFQSRATVGNPDLELVGPDRHRDRERPQVTVVGVEHDVVASFADRRCDVFEQLAVELICLGKRGQHAAHEGDVLGAAFQLETNACRTVAHI
jgi:hypothetical protein